MPDRTRGAGRFVKEDISILRLTLPRVVIDLYHVSLVVFIENSIHFLLTLLLLTRLLTAAVAAHFADQTLKKQ